MLPPIQPSLAIVRDILSEAASLSTPPNLLPLCTTISAEFLTPSSIYLKLKGQYVLSVRFMGVLEGHQH